MAPRNKKGDKRKQKGNNPGAVTNKKGGKTGSKKGDKRRQKGDKADTVTNKRETRREIKGDRRETRRTQ